LRVPALRFSRKTRKTPEQPVTRAASFLFFRFLVPLKNIELNENKCHQPQEGIPEIKKRTFKPPIGGCHKQHQVKETLQVFTDDHETVCQMVPELQPDFQLKQNDNDQPGACINDIDGRQSPG